MMEQPVVSIQAEQKRTYYALALGVTKSTNDTISGSDLLHLNCRGAFTGSIRSVQTLRDDAVKVAAGSFEPFVGKAEISRRWRKPHIFSRSEIPTRKLFEKFPAFAQRLLQVRSFTLREKIEYDVCRRMRFGQFLNATCRGMQTQLQFIKRKRAIYGDNELAVHNELFRRQCSQSTSNIWKIARERLTVL